MKLSLYVTVQHLNSFKEFMEEPKLLTRKNLADLASPLPVRQSGSSCQKLNNEHTAISK